MEACCCFHAHTPRWSAVRAFLDPSCERPSLRIETRALLHLYAVHGKTLEARGDREVLHSCGAASQRACWSDLAVSSPNISGS